MIDKPPKSVQILSIELHVIVPCPLHPQWVYCVRGSLENCQPMGEVNYFIFCSMDDQYSGRHSRDFLNAG